MEKLFIPFDIAIDLAHKGFNEGCFGEYRQWDGCTPYLVIPQNHTYTKSGFFTIECNAPMYQQVVDWFREKHKIEICPPIRKEKDLGVFYGGWIKHDKDLYGTSYGSNFENYYDAYNEGIIQALKLI